jgi:copper chaperone NosL
MSAQQGSKSYLSYLVVLVLAALIVVVFLSMANVQKMVVVVEGNLTKTPLAVELGHYQDSDCGMVINDLTYASQAIAPDGKTWFFHDIGGMVNWLQNKSFKRDATLWVWAKDTKQWIDAHSANYSRTDITPMGYGFGAYEKHNDKLINYEQMSQYMLRGETLNNPYVKGELLGNH